MGVQALDRARGAHAADPESLLGPERPVALHRAVERHGERRVLVEAPLERAHAARALEARHGLHEARAGQPEGRREGLAVGPPLGLLHHHRPAGCAAAGHAHGRDRGTAELPLQPGEVLVVDHPRSVRGRSAPPRGEGGTVRRLIVIGIVVLLAVLFVQPIRGYRAAQEELDRARVQLREAREAKQRAVEERDALGTREMLVREARRRGYIFPGETPFSVGER
ncbi:MAG: hypothetical protein FJW81_01985 [Actinobacteria bacterium]|nr:hypothetical protein [Actinomycetota bacterium]